jgi:hypothetical protein
MVFSVGTHSATGTRYGPDLNQDYAVREGLLPAAACHSGTHARLLSSPPAVRACAPPSHAQLVQPAFTPEELNCSDSFWQQCCVAAVLDGAC